MTRLIRHTLAALLVSFATLAFAQGTYPERPITLVVPTAAGGGTDTIARFMGEGLYKLLGQPVVIDNKPGANGIIGTQSVAQAQPDGYRLLFTYTAAHVVNPFLVEKLPYDPIKDFMPIAQIGRGGNLLLVNPKLPVKTLKEFVDYVRSHPGQLNYCSWGVGSGGHLAMESLKKQAKLDMTHIAYKGSAPCVQDIIGGQVQAGFGDTSSTIGLVLAGKLRALATNGPARLPRLPDVPTVNEAGYPFHTYSWYGLFAPAGTPEPIIRKLNAAVEQLLGDPAIIAHFRELNFTDLPKSTPEQFAETVRRDMEAWGKLVRSLDLKP